MFYAAFTDLTLHYVGPFETTRACDEHAEVVANLGDLAKYKGAVKVEEAEVGIDVSSAADDLHLIRSMLG